LSTNLASSDRDRFLRLSTPSIIISLSLYLFISLSLYLFISLSLYLFISLSLYLFISLSLCSVAERSNNCRRRSVSRRSEGRRARRANEMHAGNVANNQARTSVIAFAGKGGGGKTSLCWHLAVLASLNNSVACVDMDSQASLSVCRRIRCMSDDLADIPMARCRFGRLVSTVGTARRRRFDWLFIDLPPVMSAGVLTAIGFADFTVVPTRPALFDCHATQKWIALLRSAARPFGVVINGAPPRRENRDAPLVREARDALRGSGVRLWAGQITNRQAIAYAAIGGQGVAEYDPTSPAVPECQALWRALQHATVGATETMRIPNAQNSHLA
jgi:chromosome partitioning protein